MDALIKFGKFWYHFIIGDDWRIAVGVIAGLCLAAVSVHIWHVNVWWLLPGLVFLMVTLSLWQATRK